MLPTNAYNLRNLKVSIIKVAPRQSYIPLTYIFMSTIFKRFINTVRLPPGVYSSQKSLPIQAYIVAALKEHCKNSGIDALGADSADIA
jgi:hypothetical protein